MKRAIIVIGGAVAAVVAAMAMAMPEVKRYLKIRSM
jgi:hypothetical protein